MNVLLINPHSCSPRAMRLPLSLLALGSVLEGRYPYQILDGNVDPDPARTAVEILDGHADSPSDDWPHSVVGVTVMPGPQVGPAIRISSAIRAAHPKVPIVWGGYFPTLYPDPALNAGYVDYLARGQGEQTLLDLLERLPDAGPPAPPVSASNPDCLEDLPGLSFRDSSGIIHNPDRGFQSPDNFPPLPYERVGDVQRYLRPSFLGVRTGVHQAATGCRYNCSFCGVASMYNGRTHLQAPDRLLYACRTLRDRFGATAMQFYDNNFFDREENSIPFLDALASIQMPWWCFARADTLAGFPASTWDLIRRSQLKMTYIGAEAATDSTLLRMKKGTRVEHTLEVANRCREYGVIPEFSFILGGPEDPEGEVERTFAFIRRLKQVNPRSEIILYFYSPTPRRLRASLAREGKGVRLPVLESYGPSDLALPTTPEEWADPRWVSYVCHEDAPWLTPRLRQRIKGFARVLGCRFPTVQDVRTPAWGKALLREMARWRYSSRRFDNPWELDLARRYIGLREPQRESL